jgi:hypothetical protein
MENFLAQRLGEKINKHELKNWFLDLWALDFYLDPVNAAKVQKIDGAPTSEYLLAWWLVGSLNGISENDRPATPLEAWGLAYNLLEKTARYDFRTPKLKSVS